MKTSWIKIIMGALLSGVLMASASGQPPMQSPRLVKLDGSAIETNTIRPVASSAEGETSTALAFECQVDGTTQRVLAGDVFAVQFHPWSTISITSDAEVLTKSLGNRKLSAPAPAGWGLAPVSAEQGWTPAIATVNARCMYYIPAAHWIWSPSSDYEKPRFERTLFQKTFSIPESLNIVHGKISLTGCHEINGLFINGQKINRDDDLLCFNMVKYDVTDSLKPGANVIAIEATAPEDVGHGYGGLSFRLDVDVSRKDTVEALPDTIHNCALVLSTNDVIKGDLTAITNKAFVIRHAGGEAAIAREWIDSAQFPSINGPSPAGVTPALSDKGGCGMHTVSFASPRLAADKTLPVRIVDHHGRIMAGDVLAMDKNGRLMIEHEKNMPPMMMDLTAIQEITFVAPQNIQWNQFKPGDYGRVVRLHTIDGNVWHGLLDTVQGESLVIQTPYAGALTFPLPIVTQIVFPYQGVAAALAKMKGDPNAVANRVIAIIGEFDPQPNNCTGKIVASLNVLGHAMGYHVERYGISQILNKDTFNPERIPLVINLDERQRSYDGWNKTDDVKNAMVAYMEQGGNLIHMASGTPFYFASQRVAGEWAAKPCAETFNRKFGLHVAFTGEMPEHGMCIERPNNSGKLMTFEKLSATAEPYPLPQAITFNAPRETRFRPVQKVTAAGDAFTFIPLYQLKADDGTDYGHAAALSQFKNKAGGTSTVGYVAFPLVASEWDDVPAVNFLFPWLMAQINPN